MKEVERSTEYFVAKREAKEKAYSEMHASLETTAGEKDLYWLARQKIQYAAVSVIKDRDGNVQMSEESVLRR